MAALAARKAKVNAVGILGLVENMPDGNAQRPGDVVKTMSGQTVEVINTDAEGRLVLADALWYCQDRFKPKLMIDLATLTGAIIIALGKDLGGMFCNDDALAENLMAASKASADALWRMPMPAQYEKQIESGVADMKNVGTAPGRLDHRGAVHPALRQRPSLGAPRYRLHRLEAGFGRPHHPQRRHRLWRAAARSPGGRFLRGLRREVRCDPVCPGP